MSRSAPEDDRRRELGHESRDGSEEGPVDPLSALDRLPSSPRPAFRASLREAFVSGRLEDRSEAAPEPGPELRAALDAWVLPPARETFRRGLAARFVAGDAAEAPTHLRPVPANGAPRRARHEAPTSSRRRPAWLLAGLAAAAAVVALVALSGRDEPGPSWRVLEVARPARVELDGRAVSDARLAELPSALRRGGCSMTVDDGLLRMSSDEQVALEVGEHTSLRVVPREDYRGRESLVLDLRAGTVRLRTGVAFEGLVVVTTPDGRVELDEGILGIDVYDEGTCLCLVLGRGRMLPSSGGEAVELKDGFTRFFTRGGGDSGDVDLVDEHREPLEQLAGIASRELF